MKSQQRLDWLLKWRDVEGISTSLEFAERVFRDIEEHLSGTQQAVAKTRDFLKLFGGAEVGGIFKIPAGTALPWKTLIEKSFEDLLEARKTRVVFFWDELPFMIQKIHDT